MPTQREKYTSKVYLNFKEIGEREYQTIVRFFETHEEDIHKLTFKEYFELLMAYTDSLFEVGAYSNYIDTCDLAIESTIYFNVKTFRGENIYQKLLFRKAASHYQLMQYDAAEYVLLELVKINPENKMALRFLKKCKVSRIPKMVQRTRAISIALFFLSAIIIGFELLYVNSLLQDYIANVRLSRNVVFGVGILVLIGGEILMRRKIESKVNQMAASIKISKAKRFRDSDET